MKLLHSLLWILLLLLLFTVSAFPIADAISFSVAFTITPVSDWSSGIVPIADSYQREMIEYDGRTWFWYYNQTALSLGYSSTTDGVTFQPFYAIGDTRPYRISVDDGDNGNMYVAWTNGTANIPVYFMCGAMNSGDGTISWNSSFQEAVPAEVGITFTRANIQLDSAGYPYIGYQRWNDSYSEVCLTKSEFNNSTWKTDTGFPISVSPASTTAYRVLPKRLPNQKMLIFYGYALSYLYSRYWNGSGLEDAVQVSSKTLYGGTLTEFSAVTVSDTVMMGYLSNEATKTFYFLTYDSVTKTYSSESVVTSFPESSAGITLTYDYSNSALYYFAGNYSSSQSQRCATLSMYKDREWALKDERLYESNRYNGKMLSSETVNNIGRIVVLAFPYSPNAAPVLLSLICTLNEVPPAPSNTQAWIGIAAPHVYAAVTIWSLAMIIGVGAALSKGIDVADLPYLVLMGLGILICLFVALAVMSGFLNL